VLQLVGGLRRNLIETTLIPRTAAIQDTL